MAKYKLTTGDDTITGSARGDVFDGYFEGQAGGYDTLNGAAGGDIFELGWGSASIDGGADLDTLRPYSGDLAFSTIANVEVLEVVTERLRCFASQLLSFNMITQDAQLLGYDIKFDLSRFQPVGSDGGVIDFSKLVPSGYSISVEGIYTLNSTIIGTANDDTMSGSESTVLIGGEGNDFLWGGIAYGGPGDDTFHAFTGIIDGGDGIDTLQTDRLYDSTVTNIEILDIDPSIFAPLAELRSFSLITDSARSGGNLDIEFNGGPGGSFDASARLDPRFYVTLTARDLTSGLDIKGTVYSDFIGLTAFNDFVDGGAGADTLSGGAGFDTVSYEHSPAAVTVNLQYNGYGLGGDAQGDTLYDFENVVGSRFDDHLTGNGSANTLIGGTGDDVLTGLDNPELGSPDAQGDVLMGGDGNDTYFVDSGLDLVDEGTYFPAYGSGGTDTIISLADFYWDVASVGEILQVSEAAKDPDYDGVTVVGSMYGNQMIGHSGTDIMFGRGGSDTYRPGDGVDFVSLSTLGLTDQNAYTGVDGNNIIVVDPRDKFGGASSYDIIFEFDPSKDKIDVSHYTGSHDYRSGNQVLSHAVDDGTGNCYIVLGDGYDYVYLVGLEKADLKSSDFIV